MLFDKKRFMWKSYTINKALSTTKQVQIVDSKEFIIVILNIGNKTFVVHVAIWEREKIPVHFEKPAETKKKD